ncbi:hypothetical protein [Sphingomonas sp. IW22]
MARLDEQAQGIAGLLKAVPSPEPLPVDMIYETPAATAVLGKGVVDACAR